MFCLIIKFHSTHMCMCVITWCGGHFGLMVVEGLTTSAHTHTTTHTRGEVIGDGVTASGNETHLRLQLNNIKSHVKHVAFERLALSVWLLIETFPSSLDCFGTQSRAGRCHAQNTWDFLSPASTNCSVFLVPVMQFSPPLRAVTLFLIVQPSRRCSRLVFLLSEDAICCCLILKSSFRLR